VTVLRLLFAVAMLGLVATGHVAASPDQTNQEILVKFTGRLDTQWEPVMQERTAATSTSPATSGVSPGAVA
jgi:hypothetical protein